LRVLSRNEAPSGCQTGFGSVIIPHNGKVWSSLQYGQVFKLPVVEAMNVSSASSQMPSACLVESETRIGPLTDPNLGGCIGPFPFVQNGLEFIGIGSGKFVNCPS
jgi:hypothetical protein